jgi:CO dehydrogenase maturation factor
LLGSAEVDGGVLVADLEAGLGTLSRLGDNPVDAVVVVVEPTAKSIEVATRAIDLATEQNLGEVFVVANRVQRDEDVEQVRSALDGREVFAVPDDPAVVAADREGRGLLDAAPESPAVTALLELVDRLGSTLSAEGAPA